MSEYIETEYEIREDGGEAYVFTNLKLAEGGPENYATVDEMAEGTPLAQTLAQVAGVAGLRIEGHDLTLYRDESTDWHVILADVSSALKEFYL